MRWERMKERNRGYTLPSFLKSSKPVGQYEYVRSTGFVWRCPFRGLREHVSCCYLRFFGWILGLTGVSSFSSSLAVSVFSALTASSSTVKIRVE